MFACVRLLLVVVVALERFWFAETFEGMAVDVI